MQPEEIIMQKEWDQLTAEERTVLLSLAADEEEFNLLKKMLMIADEPIDTPAIDPAIQTRLHDYLPARKRPVLIMKKWYVAAASIIVISLSAWFFLRNHEKKVNDITKTTIPVHQPVIKDPLKTDTSLSQKEKPKIDLATRNHPSSRELKKDLISKRKSNNIPRDFTVISTLLAADSSLMALVTEVY